ncbi:PIG-L family deacetylase [Clostridium algidicarnis]|uniref:PIG-L deacetylase family protein n=1 Tax=Clostridium algidicarnis TaxID=37659 RepID=UPI001C0DFAC6|nr:PIG-L deacetylase family protein [Clostridium algidicarnis]MBU3207618.1 PIG-L family deacetylase [Clostridium algidicarnis]
MNILVIAPHADDEILGVGATMAKYIANKDKVYVCVATRGVQPLFDIEIVKKVRNETILSHKLLGVTETFFLEFPAVMLEQVNRYEINDRIFEVIKQVEPDIVYIPHFGDMQKDHEIVAEAAMVAVRPKCDHKIREVYAYETLSETEWNNPHSSNAFLPNVYNDISDYLNLKVEVMKCFESQLSEFPNPRSLEAIEALAKYRGSTINAKAAEAFMLIRRIM